MSEKLLFLLIREPKQKRASPDVGLLLLLLDSFYFPSKE